MNKEQSTISFNISLETKEKLDELKYAEESYDSVLQKLLYFEEKYNTNVDIVAEYELCFDDVSKLIQIHWLNNSYTILYYNDIGHTWSNSASVWNQGCSDDDIAMLIDRFLSLMARDDVRPLLIDLEDEMVLDGLTIKRLL